MEDRELYICEGYNIVQVFDDYEYLIWTDKFNNAGDFELMVPVSSKAVPYLVLGNYLKFNHSTHWMIIETVETTIEDRRLMLKVVGRSLESILERRVVYTNKSYEDTISNIVQTLLNDHIISPSDSERKIPSFSYEETEGLTDKLYYTGNIGGNNLLDIIRFVTKFNNYGFSIRFVRASYIFSITKFEERPIVFAPDFDTLNSSSYIVTRNDRYNVVYVGGAENWNSRGYMKVKATGAFGSEATGLTRREKYVTSDITKAALNNNTTSYNNALTARGKQELDKTAGLAAFDGEISQDSPYVYGVDYNLGDVVTVSDGLGHKAKAKITEMTISINSEGFTRYPSFELFDDTADVSEASEE